MIKLKDYKEVAGKTSVETIKEKAEKAGKKHIVLVSSTYQGGGVAEILNSFVPLFNGIGIDLGWRILHGSPDFFTVTKKFHNALQGGKMNISEKKKSLYLQTNEHFSEFTHLNHDLVVVHDPQPLPLINFYKKKQPWVFRCHVDLFNPNQKLWKYMAGFIKKYDHLVVSKTEYKKNLKIPQSVVWPAIDPLSSKNKRTNSTAVKKQLSKTGIDQNKPMVSQISRFDKWKDPLGAIKVFEKVREKKDSQLVLLGSFASDDPEGQKVFEKIEKRAKESKHQKDIHLISVENNFLVNCVQRASKVVIQKSKREGFGLTVSEALFKGTPVVASNVGGIPLQVIDGVNGFLHKPNETRAFGKSIVKLLEDDTLREEFGRNGKEHVKKNFLITRLMSDWLDLFQQNLS